MVPNSVLLTPTAIAVRFGGPAWPPSPGDDPAPSPSRQYLTLLTLEQAGFSGAKGTGGIALIDCPERPEPAEGSSDDPPSNQAELDALAIRRAHLFMQWVQTVISAEFQSWVREILAQAGGNYFVPFCYRRLRRGPLALTDGDNRGAGGGPGHGTAPMVFLGPPKLCREGKVLLTRYALHVAGEVQNCVYLDMVDVEGASSLLDGITPMIASAGPDILTN
jgi:hypothetical protein